MLILSKYLKCSFFFLLQNHFVAYCLNVLASTLKPTEMLLYYIPCTKDPAWTTRKIAKRFESFMTDVMKNLALILQGRQALYRFYIEKLRQIKKSINHRQ